MKSPNKELDPMKYVMVAIPSELVPAVTEFVENQNRPSTLRLGEGDFVHGWSAEAVRRAYRESADKMRTLLRFLADHPGEEVSSEQIARAIDARFGWNTVAGMLGAFGRRSANRYGMSAPMWEYRYDGEGRILLTMPQDVAEVIRQAARRG